MTTSKRPTVWIVDDDPTGAIRTYSKALKTDGDLDVVVLDSPEIAEATWRKQSPSVQLVALDMMMPTEDAGRRSRTAGGKYSGAELLRVIREKFPLVPVIMISQLPDWEIRDVVWDEFVSWSGERGRHTPETGDKSIILKELFAVEIASKATEQPFMFEDRVRRMLREHPVS